MRSQPEFTGCIIGTAHVERLWTGGRWCEGPAWFGGGRYLIFSDIPNDRMMRYDDTDGSVFGVSIAGAEQQRQHQ